MAYSISIQWSDDGNRIYVELSDEYKNMDPATPDVGKRRILASHLKESIDVLELKVASDMSISYLGG